MLLKNKVGKEAERGGELLAPLLRSPPAEELLCGQWQQGCPELLTLPGASRACLPA